jgi:hypothetical protein
MFNVSETKILCKRECLLYTFSDVEIIQNVLLLLDGLGPLACSYLELVWNSLDVGSARR